MIIRQAITGKVDRVYDQPTPQGSIKILHLITKEEGQLLPVKVGPRFTNIAETLVPGQIIEIEVYLNSRLVKKPDKIDCSINLQIKSIIKLYPD